MRNNTEDLDKLKKENTQFLVLDQYYEKIRDSILSDLEEKYYGVSSKGLNDNDSNTKSKICTDSNDSNAHKIQELEKIIQFHKEDLSDFQVGKTIFENKEEIMNLKFESKDDLLMPDPHLSYREFRAIQEEFNPVDFDRSSFLPLSMLAAGLLIKLSSYYLK